MYYCIWYYSSGGVISNLLESLYSPEKREFRPPARVGSGAQPTTILFKLKSTIMNDIIFSHDVINTKNVTVRFNALNEHIPISDVLIDEPTTQETIEQVESGQLEYFCANVQILINGEVYGKDYLGCCFYKSFEDFYTKYKFDYFADMVSQSIIEARKEIKIRKKILETFK